MTSDESKPGDSGEREAVRRVYFRLLVSWPNGTSEGFEVTHRSVSIGRSDDCTIQIREAKVSRRHCVVFIRAGRLHLQDQGSSNGTFVNGVQVTQSQLRPGDEIRVGSVPIKVEVASAGGLYGVSLRRVQKTTDRPDDDTLSGSWGETSLTVIDRLCAVVARATDERRAARAILELVTELVPVGRAYVKIFAPKPGGQELVTAASIVGNAVALHEPAEMVIDQVVSQRKMFFSLDVQSDNALMLACGDELVGIGVVLCAPLEHDDELLGVIYCDAPLEPRDWRLESVRLFKLIASHCGAVVMRARAFEQLSTKSSRLLAEHDKYRDHVVKLERMINESASSAQEQRLELLMSRSELDTLKESRRTMTLGLVQDVRATVDGALAQLDVLAEAVRDRPEMDLPVARLRHLVRRLTVLAEDMLAVVQIEDGTFGLSTKPIEVTNLLGGVLERNGAAAIALGVRLKLGAIPTDLLAIADRSVIARVIDTLVGNALSAAEHGTTVVLSARERGSAVALTINASSTSLQPSSSRRTERPAGLSSGTWQVLRAGHKSSSAPPEPIGLGLAFCRLAAEAHGGTVTHTCEHGMSEWILELPARRDYDPEDTVTH